MHVRARLCLPLLCLVLGAAEPAAPATDLFGDPLPAGARARAGTVRLRHGGPVRAVVYSSDGRTLATAGDDATISVWDADTGRELLRCRGHEGPVRALALSADGKTIVSAGADGTVRLWDTAPPRDERRPPTGKERHCFGPAAGEIETLALDGTTLVVGTIDGNILLWDLKTRGEPRRLTQEGGVFCLALSPGGKFLAASGEPHGLRVWDLAAGKVVREFGREVVASVAFASDGRTLASGDYDNRLVLWDSSRGEAIRTLEGHRRVPARSHNGIPAVAFSPDAKQLASGGADATARVWDAQTGKELLRLDGHTGHVRAVAFRPDGKRLATGGADGTVRLWDLTSGRPALPTAEPAGPVVGVTVPPDGRTFATVRVGDRLGLWDTATGRVQKPIAELPEQAAAAAYSPDGKSLAVATAAGVLQLWDLADNRMRAGGRETPRRMEALVFSPDGRLLASSGPESYADVWDAATGNMEHRIGLISTRRLHMAFSTDGRVLAGSGGDSVFLFDTATGRQEAFSPPLTPREVRALAFVPARRALAAAAAHGVTVWELATGGVRRHFDDNPGCAAFSADGRLAATGDREGRLRVWRLADGQLLREFAGHRGPVRVLAFAGRAAVLVSGGQDGTALVWDLHGLPTEPPAGPAERDVERLWRALASEDAVRAGEAVEALVRTPAVIGLLRERLKPIAVERIERLVARLDDDSFAAREQATEELARLGRAAAGALRKALAGKPSAELKRRAGELLARLPDDGVLEPATAGVLRALEVLEAINSKESREILENVARGPDDAEATHEARAALRRLRPQR
jgi:WD40 repeat protein